MCQIIRPSLGEILRFGKAPFVSPRLGSQQQILISQKISAAANLQLDAQSSPASQAGASSKTWSHTCTGSQLVLYVAIAWQGAGTVTGVTYNAVAMTELWDIRDGDNVQGSSGYILGGASSGANNVVVTMSAANDSMFCVALSFTGGNTSSPNRTPATANSSSWTTASATASGATTGDIVVDCVVNLAAITVGANQTQKFNSALDGGSTRMGVSTQAGADGGVMSWTTAATTGAIGAVAIVPG